MREPFAGNLEFLFVGQRLVEIAEGAGPEDDGRHRDVSVTELISLHSSILDLMP